MKTAGSLGFNRLEMIGSGGTETGLPRGGLLTGRATIDLKIQDRRTGNIIGFDHDEGTATDLGITVASNAAEIKAADNLAGRILPLLAQSFETTRK